ncbi:hypothetical protein [Cereibacter changlensis]|uniref:hypothetical protein n=1 Tax=Cereibacter changlensis TaxID=402884 RepID=UPI0011B1F5DD|nr:hypothetical protein [Cereibacter changlensis]
MIRPIVEYAALDCSHKSNYEYKIFDDVECSSHSYWGEIVGRLKTSNGLYIFYDSVSKPLYVGIAPSQTIWVRANQSYNKFRDRQARLVGVKHPSSNVMYNPSQVRPVRRTGFTLADVASYFSAYEVSPDLLGGLEAFAIRAFGGALLNTKMEGNGGLGLAPVEVESSSTEED